MIQQLLFQIIFLLGATIASAQAPAITKPNCPSRCGNVTIPFPFGTKAGCYADDWFAIDCKSSKPFLRSIKLEVLEISLATNTMQVNHQVFNSCQEQTTSESVDLEATPFTFSNTNNSFTSIACNNFAYISMVDSVVIGCSSLCDNNTNRIDHNSCIGINCCQATIPSPPKKFVTSVFVPDGVTQNECIHAFLVDQKWFKTNLRNPQEVQGMKYVPVVLDWGMSTSSLFPTRSARSAGRFYHGKDFNCEASANTTSSSSQLPIVQCYCDRGYEGNPYLLQGCQDIDECAVNATICESLGNCKNLEGDYICSAYLSGASDGNLMTLLVVILYGSPGVLGLIIIIALVRLCCRIRKRRKRKERFFRRNGGLLLQQRLTSSDGSVDKSKLFNTKELRKATDNFNINRIVGQGGQGTVYKGMLADGTIVAIKKSKVVDEGKLEEFINEVAILSQINHRNVVKLLGCCLETEVPLLVYEFIPNGTLSQYLHNKNEELQLTWDMRLRIAAETAGALYYLHSSASLPIYHRDIKSTNVLLDEKYRAKIADFGISRSVAIDQTHVTTRVQGTFGYFDPEYFQSSQFTDKSDVYSFGVVLVELLTGQKPISLTRSEEDRNLATYFLLSSNQNSLYDILDDQVKETGNREEIMATANIAERCLNINGKERPTMKEVAVELERIRSSSLQDPNARPPEKVNNLRAEASSHWDMDSTSTGSAVSIPIFDNIELRTV